MIPLLLEADEAELARRSGRSGKAHAEVGQGRKWTRLVEVEVEARPAAYRLHARSRVGDHRLQLRARKPVAERITPDVRGLGLVRHRRVDLGHAPRSARIEHVDAW